MKELIEIAKKFKASPAIFNLKLGSSSYGVDVNQKYQHGPDLNADYPPIEQLVNSYYSEAFAPSQRRFVVDAYSIADNAMRSIRGCVGLFLKEHLDMKNPKQSKIYKWASRNMPADQRFNDALIALYKYIRTFADEDMKTHPDDAKHVINTLNIITAMQEKYNE